MWSPLSHTFALAFCIWKSVAQVASPGELLCNGDTYGRASAEAAYSIVQRLPFSNAKTQADLANLHAHRTFAEPRFLRPQYGSVQRHSAGPKAPTYPIAQVPRVWKKQKLSMALLMNAGADGAIAYPAVVASWSGVKEAAEILAHYCADGFGAGGSYIMLTEPSSVPTPQGPMPGLRYALMVMYLYAPGSPFEEAMNTYMFNGAPIRPYNPLGQIGTDLHGRFMSVGGNGTGDSTQGDEIGSAYLSVAVNLTGPALPQVGMGTGGGGGTVEPVRKI